MKKYSFLLSLLCVSILAVAIGCGTAESSPVDTPVSQADSESHISEPEKVNDEPEPVVEVEDEAVEPKEADPEPEPVKKDPVDEPEVITAQFTQSEDFFALMASACVSCHSEEMPLGGLSLENHEGIMAGGMNGAAVVIGDSEKSNLVVRVLPGIAQMPPGKPLTDEEIALIRAWIDAGAPKS